jgi:vitamin B12 transporter
VLKSIFYSSIALAAMAPFAARAQDLNDETVIVSASRLPTPRAEIATSNTVITADEIEARQLRDVPSILRDVPGLDVVQSGGAGGQTSLFLRGGNSNHTKVLLDGIDIGDPSNPTGAADVSKLLAGDIARVEVLRGPQSGLYGSDAIGGVISITTKSGEGPLSLNASAEGGSFDTFNQTASLSGSDGGFHYVATVQHSHAGATPVTPPDLLLPGEQAHDDYYDNVTASTKLGYDLADNLDLGLVAHANTSLGKITGDAFDLNTFTSYPSPTQSRIATLQYDGRATAHLGLWDGHLNQTLGLAYNSSIISDNDPDNGYSLVAGERVKLDWQGDAVLMQGQTLVLGAETARDAIHKPISFGITTNAGYGELQSDFGGGFFNSASIRLDDNSRYGSKVTYHVAPVWLIAATGTKLKATFGTGFKAPSLQQLFGPFGHNPLLKPETSTGYDAGVEQSLLDGALSGGVTWFHNDLRNLINYNAIFTPINIDKARTQGVESFLAWKPTQDLSLRADYTYTEATNAVTRTALLRRPANKASIGADWQALSDLALTADLLVTGPRPDVGRESFAPEKLPSFTTLNVAASYRFSEQFTLFGRIENAFDTRYQDPDGFMRPGIGAYGGIKASF